jgi:hypothetical protein
MEAAKVQAIQILNRLGFSVEQIPEQNNRTADLRVVDGATTYHIEVKEKVESPNTAKRRKEILDRGEVYDQDDPLSYNNRISSILRDAQDQLDQTPKASNTFQLIWFRADGVDADLKYRQAFSTFYGDVPLVALQPRNRDAATTCFYFDYCESFNLPTIDALILIDHKSLQVCLNEFAYRAEDFRRGFFCQRFRDLDGVIDPIALAESGKIISLRSNVSRKNDDEVCKSLKEQTGILYTTIRLRRHAHSVST